MKNFLCFIIFASCFSLANSQEKVRGCAMLKTPECERAVKEKAKENKKSSLTAQKGIVFDSGDVKPGDRSSYELPAPAKQKTK